MPHLTLEYSANLDQRVDMGTLCLEAHRSLISSGVFEPGAVRVRALRAENYAIADLLPENAFIDMSLRIGVGRTPFEKKDVGERLFAAVNAYSSRLFSTPHFALSLEIREIDSELSWKRNGIHPRLRQGKRPD